MGRFLGIDLGTQSLQALVYDSDRREVEAIGSSEYRWDAALAV